VDVGHRADRKEVVLQGLLDGSFALREDANQPAAGVGFLDEADRGLAGHRQRHEGVGEQNGVAERQDRQFGRNVQRTVGLGGD
jgi:hypothetical protein